MDLAAKTRSSFLLWDRRGTSYPQVHAASTELERVARWVACSAAMRAAATRRSAGFGLASMLDLNGDGNVLDDVMLMAGKAMR